LEHSEKKETGQTIRQRAPVPSRGVLADVWHFLVHRPAIPTLVRYSSPEERADYGRRILQRIGTEVREYRVLNIHRIGVAAPARLVFEELRRWSVIETCWPRHLAALERVDGSIACVRVFLLDRRETLFGLRSGFLGLDFIPLFRLDLLKLQDSPSPVDVDNARFLLYACRGGYPIGILAIYVRSSIAGQGEAEQSQVFFVVSFDFYGRKHWPGVPLVTPIWEWIHNRATANILNRFKDLCEARFRRIREGEPIDENDTHPEERAGVASS
jgi:hypothetical protein